MSDLTLLADHCRAQAKDTAGSSDGDLWAALADEIDAHLGRTATDPTHDEPALLEVP